jgi:hypothetical protein
MNKKAVIAYYNGNYNFGLYGHAICLLYLRLEYVYYWNSVCDKKV